MSYKIIDPFHRCAIIDSSIETNKERNMTHAKIKFNAAANAWEGFIAGKKVARRKTRAGIESCMKNSFHSQIDEQSDNTTADVTPIEKKSEFSINERFDFLTHFVRMVAKKKANSLVVSGAGGLGKTHTVIETLKACNLREDTIGEIDGDFIVIKGFTTAKAMYRTLWENNGKVVIFDDADSSFKDPIGANILKGALDSNEKRVISWNAEFSEREELPNRFEFYGRVIFISNMAMDKIPQAIQSRSLRVNLDMTTTEKVERIETVIKQDSFMPHISAEVKKDVVRFIQEHAGSMTDLNMRTAIHAAQIRDGVDDYGLFARMAKYMATA
jgi:hypothetical protein